MMYKTKSFWNGNGGRRHDCRKTPRFARRTLQKREDGGKIWTLRSARGPGTQRLVATQMSKANSVPWLRYGTQGL